MAKSGHTYGVWVTTPPGYADSTAPLPLIYVMDGNFAVGLFGYSYGGIFTLYAWLRRAASFSTIGAGSPGVAATNSQVFSMLDALPDPDPDSPTPRLHITLNEAEAIGAIPIYRGLARNVL